MLLNSLSSEVINPEFTEAECYTSCIFPWFLCIATLVTSFDMIQYAVDVSSIVQAKTISLEFTTFSTTAYTQHLKKETRIAKAWNIYIIS